MENISAIAERSKLELIKANVIMKPHFSPRGS